MITTEKLTELRDRAYRTACDKGFHDEQKPDAVWRMLIITEIAEAVQADRKELRADKDEFDYMVDRGAYDCEEAYEMYIKGCLEEELADIIIRMLDYCGMRNIKFRKDNDGFPFDRLTAFRTFPEAMYDLCEMIISGDLCGEFSLRCVICYCESLDIDILWFVEMKMWYNEARERTPGC